MYGLCRHIFYAEWWLCNLHVEGKNKKLNVRPRQHSFMCAFSVSIRYLAVANLKTMFGPLAEVNNVQVVGQRMFILQFLTFNWLCAQKLTRCMIVGFLYAWFLWYEIVRDDSVFS